jgi:glycogen synthase kinase 3 beta
MTSLPNYEIKRVIGSGAFGSNFCSFYFTLIFLGYVFEAYDHTNKRKVALKRIEKVGEQLSREFEILLDIKDCNNVVTILVCFLEIFDYINYF